MFTLVLVLLFGAVSSFPQDFVVLEADGEDRLLDAVVLEDVREDREGKFLVESPEDRSEAGQAGFR